MAPRTDRLRLTILLAVLIAVEIVLLLQVADLGRAPLTIYDAQVYDQLGKNLLDRATFSPESGPPWARSYFRTPGYPAFIAVVYAVCGRSLIAVRTAQFVLLGLCGWLLAHIAQRALPPSTAIIAAALCVTYPPLIFISTAFSAETLATAGGLLAILTLMRLSRDEPPSSGALIVFGLTLATLTFVRPAFIVFPLFCAVVLMLRLKRVPVAQRITCVTLVLVCYVAALTPWVIRNRLLVGRPVGLSSGGNWSFYVSMQQYKGEISYALLNREWDIVIAEYNRRQAEAADAARAWSGNDTRVVLARTEYLHDRGYGDDARRMLRSLSPREIALGVGRRLYWLWSTADFSPWAAQPVHRFFQAYHIVCCVFAGLGFWIARRRLLDDWPFWILPLYLTLLHLVFHVEARYTVPSRPFLLVYCAIGVRALWETHMGSKEDVSDAR
jgi:4-amino-4-deoxy-L-arabinose transferase-like glycosyltransferase